MDEQRRAARTYAGELRERLGSRLRAVVLHGSVARGEAAPGISDVNLLVLLDDVEPPVLRELAPGARRWMDKRGALPLLLAWDEWRRASDVYAIETADMIDAREVLEGEDPLEDVVVAPRHLRLQAERELRGKLIFLREGVLASAERPKDLGALVLAAMPSLATYFRAALRLTGETAPLESPETLQRGADLVHADAAPLLELWGLRGQGRPPRIEAADPRVEAVHRSLERMVEFVDTFNGDKR